MSDRVEETQAWRYQLVRDEPDRIQVYEVGLGENGEPEMVTGPMEMWFPDDVDVEDAIREIRKVADDIERHPDILDGEEFGVYYE